MNHMGTELLTEVYTSFRFPQFFPNVLFLFQDPIWDTTLHWVLVSLWAWS